MAGIGAKTAPKVLEAHGGLEALLADPSAIDSTRARRALTDGGAEDARLSYELVTLRTDIDLPDGAEDLVVGEPDEDLVERAGAVGLGYWARTVLSSG